MSSSTGDYIFADERNGSTTNTVPTAARSPPGPFNGSNTVSGGGAVGFDSSSTRNAPPREAEKDAPDCAGGAYGAAEGTAVVPSAGGGEQQHAFSNAGAASISGYNLHFKEADPIAAHLRTTSAGSSRSLGVMPHAGAPHQRTTSGQLGASSANHHARTASVIGAQNMCNLFVNNNNMSTTDNNMLSCGGGGAGGSRSQNNTMLVNSTGYITKRERLFAEEYIAALENIHKTYLLGIEGVPALRGINVEIQRGEFLVIFGTSGGGKSTLLNILGTIDVPTKGNLMLHDSRITDRTPDADLARMRCRHIGFVFQSFNLLSTMTAVENVSLPMIIAGDLTRKEIKERAEMLLSMVGLGHRMDHYPSMLSGGEQQRATIARALANEPDMLLMDEPTGDLDTKNTHLILSLLLNLNREKAITMVMVTHDVYMKPYADRILYLRDGRVANIETVPPAVNEIAYEKLLELVELDKQHVGEHVEQTNAEGKVAMSIVRVSDDYETRGAMRPVDHSGMDEDMMKVVNMLFGGRRET